MINSLFSIDSYFKNRVDPDDKELLDFLNDVLHTLKKNENKNIFQNEEVRKINQAIERIREKMRKKFIKKE